MTLRASITSAGVPSGTWVSRLRHEAGSSRSSVDEVVELEARVVLVQPAFELIAEQRAELLAGANAFDKLHRGAHAARGEIDRHRLGRVALRHGFR